MYRTIALVLLAACSSPSPPPGDDGRDQIVGPVEGQENQGRHLLGEGLDELGTDGTYRPSAKAWATFPSGRQAEVVLAGAASLEVDGHRGVDPELDQLVLEDSQGGEFRITPVRGGTDLAFYKLEHHRMDETEWTDVCDGGDAVPLAGRWTRTGLHVADPERISFACTGAVAWKCSVWGYLAGSDDSSIGWRAHQACTRMARADYCANGIPHTRDGTTITIYDRLGIGLPVPTEFPGIRHWPPDPERFFFEAAWPGGSRGAACLGRIRWQSLPIGGPCAPDVLPDPRESTSAEFCDDIDFAASADPPLLYDASRYADLELDVWVSGDDHVSTVRGYFDRRGSTPDRAPFPGESYTYVGRDGLLLRYPLDTTNPDLVEIHMYSNGNDKTLASIETALPAGYQDLKFEGYAHRTYHEPMIELRLFRNPTTGDVIATTHVPPNYIDKGLIGYILPVEP